MRMYLADMHTHTQISPDSGARLADMARAAAAAGLDELYVTDHCDLLDGEGRFCARLRLARRPGADGPGSGRG